MTEPVKKILAPGELPISLWHMIKNRRNPNAYYSPGVDRFFAVDNYDPYTANEIAQILSSKVPGIGVCVLNLDDPFLTNADCHKYTLKNKNIFFNGASILFARQFPALRKMASPLVTYVSEDLPLDYQDSERRAAFNELKEYAQYVIKAWHSAKLCDLHFNFMPMDDYTSAYYKDLIPEDFMVPADNTNTGVIETGLTKEIRKILYFSESVQEVKDNICNMWLENNVPLTANWRAMYYRLIGEEVPPVLASSEADVSRYSGYIL